MSYTMTEQDLSKLVADKMHRLTSTAYKITKDWHEAEDAAQQGCIKAFRYMHNFRGDCKPYSWVTRIVVNEAKRIADNRNRRPPNDDVPVEAVDSSGDIAHSESPEAFTEMLDLQAVISEAMETMQPDFAEVLSLREDKGLTYSEITDKLGILENTARTRLAKGKAHIKRCMEGEQG